MCDGKVRRMLLYWGLLVRSSVVWGADAFVFLEHKSQPPGGKKCQEDTVCPTQWNLMEGQEDLSREKVEAWDVLAIH